MKETTRKLDARDRALVGRILERPFPGRDELLRQLDLAAVRWIDGRTSPALVFDVSDLAESAPVEQRTPLEATYVADDVDGGQIYFVLHVKNGYLSELEIFRSDGEAVIILPDAAALKPAY
jgi:hypothetical protein